MLARIMIGGAIALLAVARADAGFPVEQEMVCAVGGGTFTHITTGSYSTFGERPDGKPYGSWEFPLAIPDCPDNRLVMYRDFAPDEIAQVSALIAAPEYRAHHGDTDYYRAQWLHTRLGGSEFDALSLLMRATWQPEPGSAQRERYLTEFVQRVSALPRQPDDLRWVGLAARAANAQRELGRFDDAVAATAAIVIPDTATTPDMSTEDSADVRTGWRDYLTRLSTVAARRESNAQPFGMIGERYEVFLCLDAPDQLSEADRAACKEPARAAKMAEVQKARGR